ncbi:MAG: glycosyltransferase family 1 protein [Oscillospiraceae bacterium]|jgi:glycosyltransferase involved in cell wall biosynthesis|nr:glycosyltransferase family 1 protein [Oscillospiraceae bacterium]
MKPIRILHVAEMNSDSGVACFLMNYYRNIDRSKVQFDFIMDKVYEKNFIQEIESLGGKVFVLPNYKKNPFAYYAGIKSIIKNSDYKIIHAHEAVVSLFSLRAAKKCGIQTRIAHSHNNKMESKLKDLVVQFARPLFQIYCTDFWACSTLAAQYLFGKKICKSHKINIFPNAIDSSQFEYSPRIRDEYRQKLDLNNKIVIGHVGRFNSQKNHTFLIDIFSEMKKIEPSAHLLLIGEGDTQNEMKAKVNNLMLKDSVSFLGIRSDVNNLMQAMDAFVFPSHFEGLGIVLVEAQASGLMCFTSENVVPYEAKVTDNLEFISLEKTAEAWATAIIARIKEYNRVNTRFQIENAGYDILRQATNLQEFYLATTIKRGEKE